MLPSASASGGTTNAPGIWSAEQVAAWRTITDAIHAKGCFIWCQLWHPGRAGSERYSSPTATQNTPELITKTVSSSALPLRPDSQVPEELSEEGIRNAIAEYAAAARNAIAAGFDGVEVHSANGYLPDQFLQDTCNKRTDAWGGSVENRARFPIEVVKAVAAAVGARRTSIRLSPYSDFNGMLMDDPDPTFRYVVEQLRSLGLGYLHLIEARISGNIECARGGQRSVDWLVRLWDNASPVLLAGGFTPESARKAVDATYAGQDVVIVFGRAFISNPDLVYRIRERIELVKHDRAVFYTPKLAKGYIDYPFSPQFATQLKSQAA
jgi:NADPH2 dehydrogenase